MRLSKENITTKLIPADAIESNKEAFEVLEYYSKVSDIIERTHVAMGKRNSFKIVNASTKNQKLCTNVYASTH